MQLFELEALYQKGLCFYLQDAGVDEAKKIARSVGGVLPMKQRYLAPREELWSFQEQYLSCLRKGRGGASSVLFTEVNEVIQEGKVIIRNTCGRRQRESINGGMRPFFDLPRFTLGAEIYLNVHIEEGSLDEEITLIHELGHAYDLFEYCGSSILKALFSSIVTRSTKQLRAETESRQYYVTSLLCETVGLPRVAKHMMAVSDTLEAMLRGDSV